MLVRGVVLVACVMACDAGEQHAPRSEPSPRADEPRPPADESSGEVRGATPSIYELPYDASAPVIVLTREGGGIAGNPVRATVHVDGTITFERSRTRCKVARNVGRARVREALVKLAPLFLRDPNDPGCVGIMSCGTPENIAIRADGRAINIVRGVRCPSWIESAFQTVHELVGPNPCPRE